MDYGHEQADIAAETPRDRQPPLCLRWETRGIWTEVNKLLPMERPEAAIGTDIVLNALGGKPWTSYSRDKNVYHKGDAPSVLWTYGNVVPTIDEMERRGLIEHDKRAPSPKGCGWRSALSPKPVLVEAVQEAIRVRGKPVPVRPTARIVLRDAKGIPLELPRTRKMLRMAAQVEAVNRFMEENGEEARFRRIFSQTFERGGRWYCFGGAHQVLSSEERLRILIGGERSSEVDYRNLHPAFLYSERGLKMEGDAYDLDGWPRELTKLALLVLINASDLDQAVHAIAGKEAMRGIWTPGSEDAQWAAKRLIREIRKKHRAIEDAFCSDSGARLMRKDSDITTAIMTRMMRKGVVCLPVHDSYISRGSACDLLQDTMLEAAAEAGLHDIELKVSTASEEGRSWRDNPLNNNDNRPIVLTYPYIPCLLLPPSPVFQDGEQDSERVRPSAARELDFQAEGRTSFDSPSLASQTIQDPLQAPSIPVSDSAVDPTTGINALRIEFRPDTTEDASEIESPLESSLPRSQTPSVLHPVPSIAETAPMPVDSDVLHRSAVLSAGRLVHGPAFAPRYGEKHLIRKADGPARRTVLATARHVADVWAPEDRPILVRMSSCDSETSTTLVAPSRDDALAMAAAYLHGARTDGGTGDLAVDATVYGSYDPAVPPATNLLSAREIVMSLPRPRARTSVPPVRPAAAPAPVRQPDDETAELLRSYGVSSLADLPYGAAKLVSKPKPRKEFA